MIEYAVFLHGLAQQWRPRKKRNVTRIEDEDDARTSNTRIAEKARDTSFDDEKYDLRRSDGAL